MMRCAGSLLGVAVLAAASGTDVSTAAAGNLRGAWADAAGTQDGAVRSLASRQLTGNPGVSKVLQVGDADARQLQQIQKVARKCFDKHPIDTSNAGQLDGSLGAAVGCVQRKLENKWGWEPTIDTYGSASCGQCDGYGSRATVVEVITDSGNWMFVIEPQGAPTPPPAARATAASLQKGDASDAQLADILSASGRCFDEHPVDTSNMGQLDATLGAAIGCVQSACESKWGWTPFVSNQGSYDRSNFACCDGYGLGATVIAVETPSLGWMFVMRLKGR